MAPNISASTRGEADAPEAAAPVEHSTPAPGPAPAPAAPPPEAISAEVRRRLIEERLRVLRAHVEANAENVGGAFADEARRIHEGDAEDRAIYGDATTDEVEALIEDEIPVAPLPWIDRRDD